MTLLLVASAAASAERLKPRLAEPPEKTCLEVVLAAVLLHLQHAGRSTLRWQQPQVAVIQPLDRLLGSRGAKFTGPEVA